METSRNSDLAMISMILGIVSIFLNLFCCCGFLIAIPAIIVGHSAMCDIRRNSLGGRELALVGLWAGYLSLIFPFMLFIGYLLFLALLFTLPSLFS